MGRKSNSKGKEKKLKKREEMATLAAKQALVDAANAQDDPMASLEPFKKFDRNGLGISIGCFRVSQLDQETIDWAFQLTKTNMQSLYETSEWGWSDREKRNEMTEDKAIYLVARDSASDKPVAMVHFRFDIDCDDQVLYCYDIQLSPEVQRKGLGKFLIQILELLAFKTQMKKVVLTVFRHNDSAREFFMNKLKYDVDETNLEDDMFDSEGSSYQILSKTIALRKPAGTLNDACTGHCCH